MSTTITCGHREITMSEQADCVSVIIRDRNPYALKTITTHLLLSNDAFSAMFSPMVEIQNEIENS